MKKLLVMKIEINGSMVPVYMVCGDSVALISTVVDSVIFQNWVKSIDPRFEIENIFIEQVDFRGLPPSKDIMFVRLSVLIGGHDHRQIVQLRGGTCVMLPILNCGMEQYTILVSQARLAVGEYELKELPAGMIDGGSFSGAAARELEEELGLTFEESELIDITGSDGIYFSPGILDEKARFYLAQKDVTPEELKDLKGKVTGLQEEGEKITLHVVEISDVLCQVSDMKTIAAISLYANHMCMVGD